MSELPCYESAVDDQGQPAWRRLDQTPWLVDRDGTLVLEPPLEVPASVNGLDIIGGFQVIEAKDWVRSAETSFLVGREVAQTEPANGRMCEATGRRIDEEYAVRCAVCGTLFAQSIADQMGKCLKCGAAFHAAEDLPPEELL